MSLSKGNYSPPLWADLPKKPFSIDVIREGSLLAQYKLEGRDHFFIGCHPDVFIEYKNPCVSRFHAVIQFKNDGTAYIMDLNSTHGTWLGDTRLNAEEYVQLYDGNRLTFGSANAKRCFIICEESLSAFPKDIIPHVERLNPTHTPSIVFDEESHITESAERTLDASYTRAENRSGHTLRKNQELNRIDPYESEPSLKEYIEQYIDSKTGLLHVKNFRNSKMFSRLTPIQLETFNDLVKASTRLRAFETSSEDDYDQDHQNNTTKKVRNGLVGDCSVCTVVQDQVLSEIHILQRRFINLGVEDTEAQESANVPNSGLSEFMKESMNERLFDEDDTFFDRTAQWNQPQPSTVSGSLVEEGTSSVLKSTEKDEGMTASCDTEQPFDTEVEESYKDEDPLDFFMRQNELKLKAANNRTTEAFPSQHSTRHSSIPQRGTKQSSKAISIVVNVLSRINEVQQKESNARLKENQKTILMNDKEDDDQHG